MIHYKTTLKVGELWLWRNKQVKFLKSRQFRAVMMHRNFELWVSVFNVDNDPTPKNAASLTIKNPIECMNIL